METRRTRAVEIGEDTLHATLEAFVWEAPLPDLLPRGSITLPSAAMPEPIASDAPQGGLSPSQSASG